MCVYLFSPVGFLKLLEGLGGFGPGFSEKVPTWLPRTSSTPEVQVPLVPLVPPLPSGHSSAAAEVRDTSGWRNKSVSDQLGIDEALSILG